MQSIRGRFATTQWTLVLAAGRRGSAEAEEALARLCSLYWYPVFAFVRRQGHPLMHAETPERLYHRQWCLTLLASVLDTVQGDYRRAGNEHLFERLRGFLTMDDTAGTHADAAADLNMTPAAVKVAAHRLRRRYRDALLARVPETVDSDEAIDDEIRYLLKTVSAV